MNRTERRSWDRYVAEAREVFSEVDLGGDNVIRVYIPTAEQAERLQRASRDSGIWDQLDALMGTENVTKLREVAENAPITALSGLLNDILIDLGLQDGVPSVDTGNSPTSSS